MSISRDLAERQKAFPCIRTTGFKHSVPGSHVSLLNLSIIVVAIAALASLLLIAGLRRFVAENFLSATIDHRSNHTRPARQIGGIAAVPVAAIAFVLALRLVGLPTAPWAPLGIGMFVLWATGAIDDHRGLGAPAKFAVQFAAAAIVVFGSGLDEPFAAFLPHPVALLAAVIALVWFVNMVNFMDGMDLITAGGAGTATLFAGALGLAAVSDAATWIAAVAIFGALAGFAFHNRPPAPVFLGDSGSLPLGLAAGYLSLRAAETVSLFIAFLPFAYYLIDTITTVAKRAFERKNILAAHSEHAYQVARRAGIPVATVVGKVAGISLFTGCVALLAVVAPRWISVIAVASGWLSACALVVHLRYAARRGQGRPAL